MTDDKLLASLHAVSKHLKGQTTFSIFPSHKIVIVGDYNISDGYVYEVELIGLLNMRINNGHMINQLKTLKIYTRLVKMTWINM